MADRENVIKGIDICLQRFHCGENCPYYNYEKIGCMEQLRDDALELLDKQNAEKKRILKIVWDTLHEGLSIDTVSDQDWVYERIRNRIEGTYPEV